MLRCRRLDIMHNIGTAGSCALDVWNNSKHSCQASWSPLQPSTRRCCTELCHARDMWESVRAHHYIHRILQILMVACLRYGSKGPFRGETPIRFLCLSTLHAMVRDGHRQKSIPPSEAKISWADLIQLAQQPQMRRVSGKKL